MSQPVETQMDRLVAELPGPVALKSVSPMEFDCFIAIAGFEARCVGATVACNRHGTKGLKAICVQYCDDEMATANNVHVAQLMEGLRTIAGGAEPTVVAHDEHQFDVDFGTKLCSVIESLGMDLNDSSVRIGLDISVGSSRVLLEGLHALLNMQASLTLVYSEAAEYRPLFAEYLQHLEEQKYVGAIPPEFLTVGVDQVNVLGRIPGRNADARPTFLVAFPSFSRTRMEAVLEELSPSRVQWIFGIPHLVQNRWRMEAQRDYHASLIERSHRLCYVSTFDYRETLASLNGMFAKRRSLYSMLVASMGSKMQKVGQVLFHLMRPEVGAVVSVPRRWEPNNYSSVSPKEVYVLELGGGETIRRQLTAAKSLKM